VLQSNQNQLGPPGQILVPVWQKEPVEAGDPVHPQLNGAPAVQAPQVVWPEQPTKGVGVASGVGVGMAEDTHPNVISLH
jgi:hypothetical protein